MKANQLNLKQLYIHIKGMLLYHDHGYGMLSLLGTALLLAFFIGIPHTMTALSFLSREKLPMKPSLQNGIFSLKMRREPKTAGIKSEPSSPLFLTITVKSPPM